MKVTRRARLVVLLMSVILMSNVSRLIFSPLLVPIKDELGFSQSRAGSLFLIIALGYSPGMLFSGYLTARIRHRGTILCSLLFEAAGLLLAALSGSFAVMAAGLVLVGIGSGVYPPSGNASIAAVIRPERKGIALAIHEMGPNLGFLAAPLIVLALFDLVSWRGILLVLVCVNLCVAFIYARQGFGGEAYGQTPQLHRLKAVLKLPEAWFIFLLECVGLCALQGVFTILPMFLVTARNLDPDLVNKLISLSRVSCVLALIVSGALVNTVGVRTVIFAAFFISGISTFFLGVTTGAALLVFIVVQPAFMAAFFPAATVILLSIGPRESQNVTFSFIISFAVLIANGIVPTFLGWLGDRGMLAAGFVGLAALILLCAALVYRSKTLGRPTASPSRRISPSG
ncbi:MAG: MFS transporter [Spirochaetales bacterium]|jgi:NNP family nitrate/nitrite transporter-like MFS transporter|nr:MFS transporter [Spirochaetales bacterium]